MALTDQDRQRIDDCLLRVSALCPTHEDCTERIQRFIEQRTDDRALAIEFLEALGKSAGAVPGTGPDAANEIQETIKSLLATSHEPGS